MRVILDTNVLVSGVFFGGLPRQILEAWRGGDLRVVASPEILDEYEALVEEVELIRDIREARAQLERGEGIAHDEVIEELRTRLPR